ncbi:MAG: DUF5615 family PIN-like protein, partial [Candidatus Coatesbacteria bacterium]|nr:DUF5615 family PIN-like protein [Candidatus Coatesbacteria bacterium]
MAPSISDEEVINLAADNNALVLTADKDFGDLIYRQGIKTSGVILIRLSEFSGQDRP